MPSYGFTLAIGVSCQDYFLCFLGQDLQFAHNFLFAFGKSRMCPTDARTINLSAEEEEAPSRYFSIVLALEGDSTINNFIQHSITRNSFAMQIMILFKLQSKV